MGSTPPASSRRNNSGGNNNEDGDYNSIWNNRQSPHSGLRDDHEDRSSDDVPLNRSLPLSTSDCANFYKLSDFDCDTAISYKSDARQDLNTDDENDVIVLRPSTSSSDVIYPNRCVPPSAISGAADSASAATCANQPHRGNDAGAVEKCCRRIKRLQIAARSQTQADANTAQATNRRNGERADELFPFVSWQAKTSTIRERTGQMFLNPHLADVMFVIGNSDTKIERIPAHKFVLAIGSAVFDAMFRFDSAQNPGSSGVQEVRIIDVEPKAFTALLRFLYKDESAVSSDTVMATLYAAKKYAVPALEFVCVDYLRDKLNADNAFFLLAQSRFFDETAFADSCLETIDRDTADALQSDGFLEIDHDTLCAVLQRDALRINELPLFQAVVRWALEECKRRDLVPNIENQRTVLGQALRLIRYTEMTITEFAENVATSGLLTSEELVSIFLHFTMSSPPPIPFPIAQRRRFVGKQLHINRFQRVEASWGYSGTPDRIKFVVDVGIWLLGFGLYGSMNDSFMYEVTIELINSGTGLVLAHCDTSFHADGSTSIFPVLFNEPVEISPTVMYIASAKLMGPESHYGSKGLRRIVRQISSTTTTTGTSAPPPPPLTSSMSDIALGTPPTAVNSRNMAAPAINNSGGGGSGNCITFQFSFAPGNNNGTSVDDGQIPQLIFSEKY